MRVWAALQSVIVASLISVPSLALTGTFMYCHPPVAVQYPVAVHPALAFVFDDVEDQSALHCGNKLEVTNIGEKIRLHDPERFNHK